MAYLLFYRLTERQLVGEKVAKVKAHLVAHKNAYLAGAGGFLVGSATTVLLIRRGALSKSEINILGWKNTVKSFHTTIIGNGHPGKVILDTTTDRMFKSQNEAAKELGVSVTQIVDHLNGKKDHVLGHHLIDLGRAA